MLTDGLLRLTTALRCSLPAGKTPSIRLKFPDQPSLQKFLGTLKNECSPGKQGWYVGAPSQAFQFNGVNFTLTVDERLLG